MRGQEHDARTVGLKKKVILSNHSSFLTISKMKMGVWESKSCDCVNK